MLKDAIKFIEDNKISDFHELLIHEEVSDLVLFEVSYNLELFKVFFSEKRAKKISNELQENGLTD